MKSVSCVLKFSIILKYEFLKYEMLFLFLIFILNPQISWVNLAEILELLKWQQS